jgi:hypothetical protein
LTQSCPQGIAKAQRGWDGGLTGNNVLRFHTRARGRMALQSMTGEDDVAHVLCNILPFCRRLVRVLSGLAKPFRAHVHTLSRQPQDLCSPPAFCDRDVERDQGDRCCEELWTRF